MLEEQAEPPMQLKNDHNVYILGAGFSRDAGLPLISDFLVKMRDSHEWLRKENRSKEAEAVENVLKFRLEAASAAYWVNLDLENIEELFSLASATKGDMDRYIRIAIAATLEFALQTKTVTRRPVKFHGQSKLFGQSGAALRTISSFPGWVEFKEGIPEITIQPYTYHVARLLGMFRDGKPKGQNTFITFNYDNILERALDNLGIDYTYALDKDEVSFAQGVRGQGASNSIPILKLHGSVNWGRQVGPGGPLSVHDSSSEVLGKALVPELIPPTWKKLFQRQLQAVWDRAIQELGTATRIIIIGFSIPPTDLHFKYLLAAGLQANISLRQILFVNPAEKAELEPRVRRLLRDAYVNSRQIDIATVGLEAFTRAHPADTFNFQSLERPGEYGLHVCI